MIGEGKFDPLGLNERESRKKLLEIRGVLDTRRGYSVSEWIQPFKIVRLGERCVGVTPMSRTMSDSAGRTVSMNRSNIFLRARKLMDEANARNRWWWGAAE